MRSKLPFESKNKISQSGFTIVELLIVIVIIGALASITLASYIGISKKANEATIQADLANASKKIKMYYALYNSYPESMPNDGTGKYCPSGPTVDTNYCIKPSTGTFTYSAPTPTVDFSLVANSGTLAYTVTKDNGPTSTATTPITTIGAITGTAQIGQTLTAGAVTPGGATVSYRWQSSATSNGVFSDIPGAISNVFVVTLGQVGKYIRVQVSGTGVYSDTQISSATTIVADPDWITIGTQTWARANLNVGNMINNNSEQTNNSVVEKYCYSNSPSNCVTYGGLYQWNEMMNYISTEPTQGICPASSHIPTNNDWKILESALGMTQSEVDLYNAWRGTDQGTKMKVGGSSGLNLTLSGTRDAYSGNAFHDIDSEGYYWTSTQTPGYDGDVYIRRLNSSETRVVWGQAIKLPSSFPVRCIKN